MTDSWIHPTRVHQLSWETWGFLNMNLKGDARMCFENVPDFQSFEAWRKIMKLVRNRSEVRKLSLHNIVQKPAKAKSMFLCHDGPAVLRAQAAPPVKYRVLSMIASVHGRSPIRRISCLESRPVMKRSARRSRSSLLKSRL